MSDLDETKMPLLDHLIELRTRLLWSERDQVALVLESGSLDGWRSYRMTLHPKKVPTRLPWQDIGNYAELDIRDFFD